MKFSLYLDENQFQPWKNEYIQYDELKDFIKEKTQHNEKTFWTFEDETYFTEKMLTFELNKVNGFIQLKAKQIKQCIIQQQEPVQEIIKRVNGLIEFIHLNSTGFRKILKKHDRWTSYSLMTNSRFLSILEEFDVHLENLRQQTSILVSRQQYNNDSGLLYSTDRTGTLRKTTTTKYWIHPDNLNEVQAVLLFYLTKVNPEESIVQTVYFDNPANFTFYNNLLERNEAAESIRVRWYNALSDKADIFFERKRYHESWSHNKGIFTKERFNIKYPEATEYIAKGTFNGQQQHKLLAASIHETMHNNGLRSSLRSYLHRTTYLGDKNSNNALRITLDTKLTFFKEKSNSSRWKRDDIDDTYPFQHMNPEEVYVFPYAVLEVKSTENDDHFPAWLTQFLESQLVYELPYFSKYLHGVSFFFRDRLPILPWWLGEMNVDIRKKANDTILESHNEPQQCIMIEPSLTPDRFFQTNNREEGRRREYEEKSTMYHGNTIKNNQHSSFLISGLDMTSRVDLMGSQDTSSFYQQRENDANKSSAAAFSSATTLNNSKIVLKIKEFREKYLDDPNKDKDEDYVSMIAWLSAKIRNDKSILLADNGLSIEGSKKEKKVEPKIFFANERTFISWLQFSALLLAVSIGLINFGDHISRGSGAFFILVAMTLAAYAQLRFQYRSWQIRFRGESRFDDMYGPAILCFVLILALIINLGLRVQQPLPTDPSLFSYNISTSSDNNVTPEQNITTIGNIYPQQAFTNGTRIDKHGHLVPIDDEP
ncbi:MAG: VTC domain-containing protein [Benjaminiella poitrasii]|nr:MAG: VTC domain-containing protein [Benjaminiella poitrasii]